MSTPLVGTVVNIWRYPVKSMLGEELNAADVTERGLHGDRAWALLDVETGKVASAKNPRRWPTLFDFHAGYSTPSRGQEPLPPVRITLPDGDTVATGQPDVETRLSAVLGRPVRLIQPPTGSLTAEGLHLDRPPQGEDGYEFPLPTGTLFDGALVHLVTTATLDRLRTLLPRSRFEVPRFRPNLVIAPAAGREGFVENDWIGKTLTLGDVQLQVDGPCPRCIMTTLAQGSLPKDPEVLRTAVRENAGNVGLYASVIRPGRIRRGDSVSVQN